MIGRSAPQRCRVWMVAAASAAVLAIGSPLHAQVATGTILGNVKDNSGAPVPGATVTATNVGTQVSRTAASTR